MSNFNNRLHNLIINEYSGENVVTPKPPKKRYELKEVSNGWLVGRYYDSDEACVATSFTDALAKLKELHQKSCQEVK